MILAVVRTHFARLKRDRAAFVLAFVLPVAFFSIFALSVAAALFLSPKTVEVYLSTINNNLSLIMKRLTGVTVILAGIGAVAGIFGMSEAGTAFAGAEATGFWIVTAFTVTIAVLAALKTPANP